MGIRWDQLYDPSGFKWSVDSTPLAELVWPLGSVAVYLVVIFALQAWMKNREPFDMTIPTVVHNAILCAWSVFMFAGCMWFAFEKAATLGWFTTFWCENDEARYSGGLIWVTYWFYLSKFWELLDSVIIVLKKKDLIFLHYYHHAMALPLAWLNLEFMWAQFWVCVSGNTFVHSFMYYYYACAALKIRVSWKRYMTVLQLAQFWFFLATGISNLYMLLFMPEYGCLGNVIAPILNMSWIISLVVLFNAFYSRTYDAKRKAH